MFRTVSAIAVAAALAGAGIVLPVLTPEVSARAPIPAEKSDRADHQPVCERQGWPYYDASCLRDEERNAGRVPQVRLVTTDRVRFDRAASKVSIADPSADVADATDVVSSDDHASAMAVPAWPEYMASLQILAIR